MVAALLGALLMGAAPKPVAPPAVDYGKPASWICRPGVDDGSCSAGLDAVAIAADGARTGLPYVPANDPPVDCFYVYPTSSLDPTPLSDLRADDERRVTHDQAARFGSRCRLFVPIYHQVTIASLKATIAAAADPARFDVDIDVPYRDILAAWRYYLAHDNHGRGIVLIGHSQGSLILMRLIAREIENRPVRRQLVAAYLAGGLTTDSATFRATPPCRTADQTGCFLAWSSYAADYRGSRAFGRANPAARPICVNPARLDGGVGVAKAYLQRSASAPASDPPYRLVTRSITTECVTDGQGAALRVAIAPGPEAVALAAALPVSRAGPTWGWHPHDIEVVQGNMLDLIATQTAAWTRRHPAR